MRLTRERLDKRLKAVEINLSELCKEIRERTNSPIFPSDISSAFSKSVHLSAPMTACLLLGAEIKENEQRNKKT